MNKQPNSHNCFICGVKNVAGAQIAFYEATAADGTPEVLARFTGRDIHQGYPGRMHGGVAAGILDEVMSRCITYGDAALDPPVWGVTVEMALRYLAPVPLGVELCARGRITRDRSRLAEASAELYLPDGTVAVSAIGKFMKMPLDQIADNAPEALGWQVYADIAPSSPQS
jgi:acyl-coenzyme A thioesterase PaaI-like protein